MEDVLMIADYILRIWGAVCIVMLIVILWYGLSIMNSLASTVRWVKQQIKNVEQSVMAPMSMLGSFFAWWTSAFDDDEFDE